MVKIYLARHGQNVDNVNSILNGLRDEPLTDLGIEQAKTTSRFIRENNLTFDKVYSSPLLRAFETAQIISNELSLPAPSILHDLIERDFGEMTGKKVSDIQKLCAPDIITTETITYFLSPKNAETFPVLIERGKRVISFIKQHHLAGAVLLVTHGDIGKMIYTAYYDLDWKKVLTDFHFGNCEVLLLADDSPASEVHIFKQNQYNH